MAHVTDALSSSSPLVRAALLHQSKRPTRRAHAYLLRKWPPLEPDWYNSARHTIGDAKQMNRLTGFAVAMCLAMAVVVPPTASSAGERTTTMIWDIKTTAQSGQRSIYNTDSDGTTLGMPCASGDLDGDGDDEAILAPFLAPSGPGNSRPRAGELHVHFGAPDSISGTVTDQTATSGTVTTIFGARAGDFLGNEVEAGDVTGDEFEDILVGAQNADGLGTDSSRPLAGKLYVISGRATWPATIDLASTPMEGVTEILGAVAGERCGFWPSFGDVNGDGTNDILVSSDLAKSSSGAGSARGKLYIIPGGPSLPAQIDLGNSSQLSSLDISIIYGIDDCDHFGSCITSGDFDKDGIDDIVCSAGLARSGAFPTAKLEEPTGAFCSNGLGGGGGPNNDRSEAGEVYIIYGRTNWPATMELSNPTADVAIYYGQNSGDHFGEDVRVGDFDGDGKIELAVGALTASAPSGTPGVPPRNDSGIGYIFWGSFITRGERVDTRALGTTEPRMTRIYGEAAGDIGADTIALADVNADGLAEMVFASPTYDPMSRAEAGDLKVIFGDAGRLPPVVDLANPPASVSVYQVIAADPGDMFAYSFTVGDFDGDGFTDLMPNGMGGDGLNNCCRDAGELYILSGKEFSLRAGRGPSGTPCLTRVNATPVSSVYYAGQPGIQLVLLCETDQADGMYVPGAKAILNGVEVQATFVSGKELRVSLDDALEVRNTPGLVTARVKNPGSDASLGVAAITLVGPSISSVKAKRKGSNLRLTLKGTDFLTGATVEVTDGNGTQIAPISVVRKSGTKLRATIIGQTSGNLLVVRAVNPGPAFSSPANVLAP